MSRTSSLYITLSLVLMLSLGLPQDSEKMDLDMLRTMKRNMDEEQRTDESGKLVPRDPNKQREFGEFWGKFRAAALAKDSAKIKTMTNLPLEAIGTCDDDPVIQVSELGFTSVFRAFLKNEIPRIEFFEEVSPFVSDKLTRVGDMEFRRTKEEWKLHSIYIEGEEVKAALSQNP